MKNIKTALFILFTLILSNNLISQDSSSFTGYIPDTITYKRLAKTKLAPGRYTFPSQFSLKNYAPTPKNQYPNGTCVGYAAAYCAMSIAHKLEYNETVTYSPYSLYNRLKDEPFNECKDGLNIYTALNKLESDGCERWVNYDNRCKGDYTYNSYNDKIEGFTALSISVDDFKNALTNYEPIVFAMRIFKDYETGRKSLSRYNFTSNGVWNCNTAQYDKTVGGHAMCIIGYDDYKNGGSGAFLVQNSWGNDWVDNGYFWLPYDEVTKVYNYDSHPSYGNIDVAYSIHTTPYFLDEFGNDNNYKSDRIEKLTIYNDTKRLNKLWLTVAYETYSGWVTSGWWACGLNNSVTVDLSARISDDFYYRIESDGYYWTGNPTWNFCTVNEAFYILQNQCIYPNKKFGKYDGTSGIINCILSNPSRDLGEDPTLETVEISVDPNQNKVDANKNWSSNYTLMDPVNNSVIINNPKIDQDYLVWIINNKNEAEEFIGSIEEIAQLNALKFANEKTANIHIAYIKQSEE